MDQVDLPLWVEIIRAIAWRAYRQRKEADDRAEWWRRTQWTIDYASDQDEGKVGIGLEALNRLEDSPLAADEDRELMRAILAEAIAARVSRTYNEKAASVAEKTRLGRRLPWARRRE